MFYNSSPIVNNFVIQTKEKQIVTVNGAIVSEVDKEASNGVIHIIEDVLLIIAKVPMGSGLETRAAQRDFSTLKTAVEAADLKETLDGMIKILKSVGFIS